MLTRALVSVLVTVLLVGPIESQNAPIKDAVMTDTLGDPLPEGAIARLGTSRFKHTPSKSTIIDSAVYSPDGNKVASLSLTLGSVRLWEAGSGKEITGPWASSSPRFSAIAFSPDNAQLAVAINSGGLRQPNLAKDAGSRNLIFLYDIAKKSQIKTIAGPLQFVNAMVFADGGKTLVAAGDGAVRWWSLDSGKLDRTWQPFAEDQSKTFTACALAPDARAIALQSEARMVTENRFIQRGESGPSVVNDVIGYELPSGKRYWQSSGRGTRLAKSQFAFSADGKRVAIVAGAEKVELRDGVNGKLLLPPLDLKTLVDGRPGGVALSADGRTLALAGGDSTVFLYDTVNKSEPRTFAARMAQNGLRATACLAFAPGDNKLLIGVDADLQVYDTETLREVAGSEGHRGWVDQLAFTPDGTRLVSGLSGQGQALPDYIGPNGELLYFSGGGTRGSRPALEQAVWSVATWKRLELVSARTPPWPNLGSMSLQQSVYVGKSGQDAARLFDVKSGQPVASMLFPDKQVAAGVGFFSPGGKHFVHYAGDNRPDSPERIYAVPSGKLVCKFVPVTANPNQRNSLSSTPGDASENIAFSPNEKRVAQFGRGDGLIRVYDTGTGKLLHTLGDKVEFDPQQITPTANWDVAFSPDNRFMASWSTLDRFLRIWDVDAGADIVSLAMDGSQNRLKLTWSPDGRVLAIGENKIRLLEIATLDVRRELPGHADATVRAMAFAPGSQILATASSDTTVLIWDMLRSSNSPKAATVLDRTALEAHWRALAIVDAGAAYHAILRMASSPGECIPWIKERIAPEKVIDPMRLETLIEGLNDDRFKVRESSMTELLQSGSRAAPAIDKALANNPTLETQRRLQSIRKIVTGPVLKGEKLQAHRAIEVLEKTATPEAVQILRSLAAGAAGGLVTTQATEALGRLKQ